MCVAASQVCMKHIILLAAALPAIAIAQIPPMDASVPASAATSDSVAKLRDAALADTVAYDIVEGLTTEVGQRMPGTEAEARARSWGAAKLKALGFKNVRIETYNMPVWVRGEETAEVISPFPQKLRLATVGNSGATPPGGLTAQVVAFASIAELQAAPAGSLTGKIAYVGNSMVATQDGSSYGQFGFARFSGPNVAATKGAAAMIIKSIGSDKGRGPHTGITTFAKGVTPIPAAALSVSDAAQLERMIARGKPVTLKLVLTPRQTGVHESGNVIGEIPGSDAAAGIVLIGGHLDSWDQGTGALDDGAGLAITTAAAKHLLDGPKPRRTIRIVWFGAEEVGGFGGEDYAKRYGNTPHAVAAESDFGADNVWRVRTNLPDSAIPVADRLAAALAPLGIVRGTTPASGGGDIDPIMKLGVGTITLDQSGQRYFDYHHTPEDTLERIDPAQLRQNVAAWTAMLAIVANAPENLIKTISK